MRNQVQLITYVDRLAGDLPGLRRLLAGPLAGAFGGVHVLPFFAPIDGADAGFDPIDHREVDRRLGTWDDIDDLGATIPVMADLIVNHLSVHSPQFQDVLANGEASPYAEMFLTYDAVFPEGATEADLLAIYRPRPGLPFTPMTLADRTRRLVWTTFTSEQVDVDVRAPATLAYLDTILDRFAAHGITMVRLDAVGYAVKTPGTSSFMTPETFAFIEELSRRAHERGIEVLVEVHAFWRKQVEIAERVDRVYDFALPPLILHALYTGSAARLRRWCEIRPSNAVTVLDTHDGIGVIDVGPGSADAEGHGLLDAHEIDELVEGIHDRSGGTSRLATGQAASNVDLYQVNCTFFDALGGDEQAYLIARLIQLWLPGIPQIYYVGLLAGRNDLKLLARTEVGRDINRHHYTQDDLDEALQRPIVRHLLAALRLRNSHPAFDGTWEMLPAAEHELAMRWHAGDAVAELRVDLAACSFFLQVATDGAPVTVTTPAGLCNLT